MKKQLGLMLTLVCLTLTACAQNGIEPSPTPVPAKPSCSLGDLYDLAAQTPVILVGTVVGKMQSAWNEAHTSIFTDIELEPEQWLKGGSGADPVTLRVPGGTVGEMTLIVFDATSERDFQEGDRVLLFLVRRFGIYEIFCDDIRSFLPADWEEESLDEFAQRLRTILESIQEAEREYDEE